VTPCVTPWKCKIPNVYRPCDGCDTCTPPWVSPLLSALCNLHHFAPFRGNLHHFAPIIFLTRATLSVHFVSLVTEIRPFLTDWLLTPSLPPLSGLKYFFRSLAQWLGLTQAKGCRFMEAVHFARFAQFCMFLHVFAYNDPCKNKRRFSTINPFCCPGI
jgi:hypothetical protein